MNIKLLLCKLGIHKWEHINGKIDYCIICEKIKDWYNYSKSRK